MIVHSHLRWDFVWQRPQQLFSRFARSRDILFVEEPMFLDDVARPSLDLRSPLPGIHRAIPLLPNSYRDSETAVYMAVRTLLLDVIGATGALARRFCKPVQWFYTPMPAPTMIGSFDEVAVVYDCMNALAPVRVAQRELLQRERFLLARAQVVFADRCTLTDAKSRVHDNVHHFGSGVDAQHFSRARDPLTQLPTSLATLRSPVLGYLGVIDERLDYALIAHLAEHLPEADIAMVGPVVNVDPHELPRRSNIHYFGPQDFQALPSFLKGFDVCLMPYAMNAATEHISPTRTLEYMASGKPIVSTPVAVVSAFTPIVRVADTVHAYLTAVRDALREPNRYEAEGIDRARSASWESIAGEMTILMEEAIAIGPRRVGSDGVLGASPGTNTRPYNSRVVSPD